MKKSILYLAVCAAFAFTSCGNQQKQKVEGAAPEGQDTVQVNSLDVENETNYFPTINRYLVNEIGKHYSQGEICVPYYSIVDVDERNAEDILVWGDFWVFNYNQSGDTLKTVSGGNHPGLMHIRQTEKGFEVTSFDQVADGAENMRSAKKIFGDKFEAFSAIQSNSEKRVRQRINMLSDYVKKNHLPVKMYQDYGNDPVLLP